MIEQQSDAKIDEIKDQLNANQVNEHKKEINHGLGNLLADKF